MKKQLLVFIALFIAICSSAQCNASFTYAATAGSVTVSAVGTPTASISGYAWQWGDGPTSVSQGQTASHTFTATGTYSVCLTYGIGALPPCTASVCQNISVIVAGIREISGYIKNVTVYPNPAKSFIKLDYTLSKSSKTEVSLFDVTGRMIDTIESSFQDPGDHNTNYDTGKLSPGLYFIRLKTEYATLNKKLIIE